MMSLRSSFLLLVATLSVVSGSRSSSSASRSLASPTLRRRASSSAGAVVSPLHRRRAPPSAVVPLAFAIPGNELPEQIFVGGTVNFLNIYNTLVTGRVLLSWFPQAQGIAALRPLYTVTDPFLNVFRGLGLNFFGLDFSILPAFLLLQATTNAFVSLGADLPEGMQHRPPRNVVPRPQPVRTAKTAAFAP
jgi:YggT family protein